MRSAVLVALAVRRARRVQCRGVTGGAGTAGRASHAVAPAAHRAAASRAARGGRPAQHAARPPKPAPATRTPARTTPRPSSCRVSVTKQRVWMCAGTRTVYQRAGHHRSRGPALRQHPDRHVPDPGQDHGHHADADQRRDLRGEVLDPVRRARCSASTTRAGRTSRTAAREYRTEGSHGCVHMPLAAMKFLYDWAAVGTTVDIRRLTARRPTAGGFRSPASTRLPGGQTYT